MLYAKFKFRSLRPLAVALGFVALSTSAHANQGLLGVWFNDTRQGAVEIYNCGDRICGKIVWLKQPISSRTGKPLRDAYNPSERNRDRPICGLKVIDGLSRQDDGSWDGGRIYDPKVGKSYNVAIAKLDSNRLRVTGYIGLPLFGKHFVWRRAPDGLGRCRVTSG